MSTKGQQASCADHCVILQPVAGEVMWAGPRLLFPPAAPSPSVDKSQAHFANSATAPRNSPLPGWSAERSAQEADLVGSILAGSMIALFSEAVRNLK